MSRIRPAAILALCAAFAAGCSTPPLERQENIEVRALDAIPRTVFVEVDGEELFGGHDQWREELTRNFELLRVCTAVLTRDPGRADLRLKVYLRSADEPAPSRVDLQGALLD